MLYVGSKQKMMDMDSERATTECIPQLPQLPRWSVSLAEFLVIILSLIQSMMNCEVE